MRGVNKVILIGNLGADPEVRFTANGDAVCNLSVATSEQWKDKESGEQQERTEWHRVVLFGKLGEIAGEYLKKGRQVYIEGSIRSNKYTDKEGIERYSTNIVTETMQMLGGNTEGAPPRSNRRERATDTRQESAPPPTNPGSSFEDDDIPF